MPSIVIPTYNERENISPLVDRLCSALDCEIVFVDDGSPDGTADEIERISKERPNVRLVRRNAKLGLTSAIVEGVRACSGSEIVVMDADLSHPPEKAGALASLLASNDLVIGSRMLKGGGVESWPFHRRIISSVAELLARLILGVKCTDPLSGFFAFRKELFARTRFRAKGYKILLNVLFDNPGVRVKEIPYFFRDRALGQTKLGPMEVMNYLADLIRIRFR